MLKLSFMNFPSLDNIKVKLKDLLIESFITNIAFILNHLISLTIYIFLLLSLGFVNDFLRF